MIDQHISELKSKAEGIEKRLCDTNESLPAEKIISLCKELSDLISAMNYLVNMKRVREGEKKIQPVNGSIIKM